MARLSFAEWLQAVDEECWQRFGLGREDLPDCPWARWYEEGVGPKGAAGKAYKKAKARAEAKRA